MPPEVSSSSQVIVNKTFEVPSIVDAKSLVECQLATAAFSFVFFYAIVKPRFPHSTCGLHNLENFARLCQLMKLWRTHSMKHPQDASLCPQGILVLVECRNLWVWNEIRTQRG
ncbi:hypothetical protein NC653_020112 [Populus alba x Populus x berolinensis]|uniref:Uncharacterized protein n=1 Tax=Populus alba x Populus x berolinensis TaxID=444605 RepID=A0AAD6MLB1_9ROSI|nr:hypothetical protein NC653_020112 [Populus alba x Populus x berolinensis]